MTGRIAAFWKAVRLSGAYVAGRASEEDLLAAINRYRILAGRTPIRPAS